MNKALREHYSAIEEAKADVVGLHNLTALAAEGIYDDDFVRRAFIGHLADLFRAVRFGSTEAHGRAALLQFNWAWSMGAITFDESSGTFAADLEALIAANRALAREILTLQAEGDYARAGALLEDYGTMRPEMEAAVGRLNAVPVDIRPRYTVKDKMRSW